MPTLPTTSAEWIALVLSNFSLALFILAILIALIDWPIQRIRRKASGAEVLFRWLVLLPLGFTGLYAFGMHTFFQDFTAGVIGWPNSPFQFEVGMANLGFGIIAILSFSASYGFRLATVIGNTLWWWGDAVGHIYQMIVNNNYTASNAGSWFWMDIIVPLLLIICLSKLKHKPKVVRDTYEPTTK